MHKPDIGPSNVDCQGPIITRPHLPNPSVNKELVAIFDKIWDEGHHPQQKYWGQRPDGSTIK